MTTDNTANILAIDTATRTLRLAVQFSGDRLVKSSEPVEKSHGQILLKKISNLMESADLTPSDLHAIGICIGPGSFTGLRIGLAAAKGMALALDIPIVAVNSFEIAAHRLAGVEQLVWAVVPLNRDECIACPIDGGAGVVGDMSILRYDRFFETIGNSAMAGIGFDLREKFPEAGNEDLSDHLLYSGADLAQLAVRKLAAGETADIATLEPLYMQKSQAEINFDRRQKNS